MKKSYFYLLLRINKEKNVENNFFPRAKYATQTINNSIKF